MARVKPAVTDGWRRRRRQLNLIAKRAPRILVPPVAVLAMNAKRRAATAAGQPAAARERNHPCQLTISWTWTRKAGRRRGWEEKCPPFREQGWEDALSTLDTHFPKAASCRWPNDVSPVLLHKCPRISSVNHRKTHANVSPARTGQIRPLGVCSRPRISAARLLAPPFALGRTTCTLRPMHNHCPLLLRRSRGKVSPLVTSDSGLPSRLLQVGPILTTKHSTWPARKTPAAPSTAPPPAPPFD